MFFLDTFLNLYFAEVVELAWGWPLVVLLLGGGLFLTLRSKFLPFFGMRHAVEVIRGKFDDPKDPGQISHFQALMTALSSTIGMGNIAGVAVAITQGGPGAVFWMWMAAIVGMATKFFTCTLACMYRRQDEAGVTQGGPMYYIELGLKDMGLGRGFRILAVMFAAFGLVGCLALFQSNQLADVLETPTTKLATDVLRPFQADQTLEFWQVNRLSRWLIGIVSAGVVAVVVLGGIQRIGKVTSKIVPLMCGLYVLGCLYVIMTHWQAIPGVFFSIVHDAFTGTAATGGAAGIAVSTVITIGVRRAAFSNEAGVGTAALAHGAAKTHEPVREGLVAMLGPFIDTVVICSMTAFVILATDSWEGGGDIQGVNLTIQAFDKAMHGYGQVPVTLVVMLFAVSTMMGYSYYGRKCFTYLFGAKRGRYYEYFYLATIVLGAVWSIDLVVNVLDTAFALMAFPNMIATLLLSPIVVRATVAYFNKSSVV